MHPLPPVNRHGSPSATRHLRFRQNVVLCYFCNSNVGMWQLTTEHPPRRSDRQRREKWGVGRRKAPTLGRFLCSNIQQLPVEVLNSD
jgi:hypothetical protein